MEGRGGARSFSIAIASRTSNSGRELTSGWRFACSDSSTRPFGIHSTDGECPSGSGQSCRAAGRAGSTMNIASSTWWMTTAFTFSQHAITTENKGAPPWNQVATGHDLGDGGVRIVDGCDGGVDVVDPRAEHEGLVTRTSMGDVTVVGLCIPWSGSRAHAGYSGERRKAWEDHEVYLEHLAGVLSRAPSKRFVMMGDFNSSSFRLEISRPIRTRGTLAWGNLCPLHDNAAGSAAHLDACRLRSMRTTERTEAIRWFVPPVPGAPPCRMLSPRWATTISGR